MTYISSIKSKLQAYSSTAASKATSTSSKPAQGVTLPDLPNKHIYNAEQFPNSAAIPANHPNKTDLIRASHAGRPVEVRKGVYAYPMSWSQEKIRTHWKQVQSAPQNPYKSPDLFESRPSTPGVTRSRRPTRPSPASLRSVQNFSAGGTWFRNFQDRGVSKLSFFSNTPGVKMNISAVVGSDSDAATMVLRDSKGNEIATQYGVEVATKTIVFTADGKPPPGAGREARGTLYLKAGEHYSVQAKMNNGSDWFRMEAKAFPA